MRRVVRWLTVGLLAVPGASWAGPESGADCGVFVLQKSAGEMRLVRREIPRGRTTVWTGAEDSGVLAVIFPPGPGRSGSLVQWDEGSAHVLRCDGRELSYRFQKADGQNTESPARSLEDLERYDIRVSLVGGDGTRRVFLLSQYRTVEPDSGPIQNLFAGNPIPLGATDYILTTDTYPHRAGANVAGEAPLELKRHPYLRVQGPDGRTGWFIVDLGAAESVVAKGFLPRGTEVEPSSMVEYSSAGRRLLAYAPQGATGKTEEVLGHVTLSRLVAGSIEFVDVRVAVMKDFPSFFDRPVAGILGLDLLRRTERLVLQLPPGAEGEGRLRLAGAAPESRAVAAVDLPFSIVGSHIVIRGTTNEVPTYFILDSGSPGLLLDTAAARAAGIEYQLTHGVRGLDRGRLDAGSGTIARMSLGDLRLTNLPCEVAALSSFTTLRDDGQRLGLLGNTFFGRFERVELDFGVRRVRFVGSGAAKSGPQGGPK